MDDRTVARSVIHADFRKKEPRRRPGEDEDVIAAEDGIIVVVLLVAVVDGFVALDARAFFTVKSAYKPSPGIGRRREQSP